MIFSCHFPWWREEGRMKIVNRQGIPQTNHLMDAMGVNVYKFVLGLFGLQICFIGLLHRIDYCGPSIGYMQPFVMPASQTLRTVLLMHLTHSYAFFSMMLQFHGIFYLYIYNK